MSVIVTVHPQTHNPTMAWNELKKSQKVVKIQVSPPKKDVPQNMVRFVCMSDTHSLTSRLTMEIPRGDVFIHAGDFTRCGQLQEVVQFNDWLGSLPHRHKVVIAGNHELSFDPVIAVHLKGTRTGVHIPTLGIPEEEITAAVATPDAKSILSDCIYLEDSGVTLYGIKIYGTPWQPEFCQWAFNLPRGQKCLEKWDLIPSDTDILVTHTPPLGHGDLCCTGIRAGCVELLSTVQQRVRPKYHVFGHIHEGYGITTDGQVVYINAATCDINYRPVNQPIVFDVPLPPGEVKE